MPNYRRGPGSEDIYFRYRSAMPAVRSAVRRAVASSYAADACPILGAENQNRKINDVVTPVFLLGSQLVVLVTMLRIILPPSQKQTSR